ncbi:MAG: MerR family transcriptional regulator [Spirochaetes bacterium]|jgi:DNA-binding transcriptional MerR regulator|nr:MerR family transcriptional regulator [Spirochaetota bacterium]
MAERTVFTEAELAERTGVGPEALRSWVESGLIQADGKASTGVSFFSEKMIDRVGHIRGLIDMGYAEEDVGKILRKVGLPQQGRSGAKSDAEHLLTVGALSESVGVSPRTIKHWEDKGIIEADARSEGGFRLYKEHYVYLCHLIQDLQLFGYSLDQIKEISDYFRDFMILKDDLSHYNPDQAARRLEGMLSEIDRLFQTTSKLRSGIDRWEKLLNKHKKLIADLKRNNDKRRPENTE